MNYNRGGHKTPWHHQWIWMGMEDKRCIYKCKKCKGELRRIGFEMKWRNAFIFNGKHYPQRSPMPRCEVAE